MLAAGEVEILADLTFLWAALRGLERDPATGRYPVRENGDPALALASYLRTTTVRQGLAEGHNVVVTSGTPGSATTWEAVAAAQGAGFAVRTVDPGREIVEARLMVGGVLSDQCLQAVARWYQ